MEMKDEQWKTENGMEIGFTSAYANLKYQPLAILHSWHAIE